MRQISAKTNCLDHRIRHSAHPGLVAILMVALREYVTVLVGLGGSSNGKGLRTTRRYAAFAVSGQC